MSVKQSPNHKQYLTTLNKMSAEQRLLKALELSAITRLLSWPVLIKDFLIKQKQKSKKFIYND
jgi:hypothetical protein